jgi:hypothetical protein
LKYFRWRGWRRQLIRRIRLSECNSAAMTTVHNNQNISADRIMRWTSIFALIYGSYELLTTFIPLVFQGRDVFFIFPVSIMTKIIFDIVISLLIIGPILQISSAVALLYRNHLGRIGMILWAWLTIIDGLLLHCCYWYQGMTWTSPEPSWYPEWGYISGWIRISLVPFAFLYILFQREIRDFWIVTPSFEVLPLARQASDKTS